MFWGDWCPFCRSEYEAEREAMAAAAGKPFALLGVNSDRDAAAVRELIGSKNLRGRVLVGRRGDGADRHGLEGGQAGQRSTSSTARAGFGSRASAASTCGGR